MSKKRVVLIGAGGLIGLALLMGAGRVASRAEGRAGEGGWRQRPIARLVASRLHKWAAFRADLNVTDEQRSQIREVVAKHRDEIKPVVASVVEKRKALRQAVMANPVDEAAIRTASDNLAKVIGDAAVLASKVIAEIRPILTEEQIKKVQEFQAERDQASDTFLDNLLEEEK
jgi:Spy/CpxP family protein refolding chaperone